MKPKSRTCSMPLVYLDRKLYDDMQTFLQATARWSLGNGASMWVRQAHPPGNWRNPWPDQRWCAASCSITSLLGTVLTLAPDACTPRARTTQLDRLARQARAHRGRSACSRTVRQAGGQVEDRCRAISSVCTPTMTRAGPTTNTVLSGCRCKLSPGSSAITKLRQLSCAAGRWISVS